MEVELFDGTVLEFPDDTADEVINRVAKRETNKIRVSARKTKEPAEYDTKSPEYQAKYGAKPGGLAQLGRGLGLAGRYALEGLGQTADIFTEPVRRLVTDPLLGAAGFKGGMPTSQAASEVSDFAGLPSPETPGERTVGEASRILAGGGGLGGLAKGGAKVTSGVTNQVMESLAANQGSQAASAVGAGAAGGYVREETQDPLAQFGASLLGGVAAPFGLAGLQNAGRSAANSIQKAVAPKDIEGILRVELQRAGIDWQALSAEARAALVKDAEKAVYSGQPISGDALRRLADYRNVGAQPTMGAVTQDPRLITQEQNLSRQLANVSTPIGGPDLPQIQNQNAKAVINSLESVAQSPMDAHATGQSIIGRVQASDDAAKEAEGWLYGQARDSAGRSVGLDRAGFVNDAFDNLARSNAGAFLPKEIRSLLNNISRGQMNIGGQTHDVPFNVDVIEQLKTMLSTASRGSGDGNVRNAIAQVRNALENVRPASGNAPASQSQSAFEAARSHARGRRTWQESSRFIEDALNGADPDSFVKRHVISGSVDELEAMANFVGQNNETRDAIRKQLVEHISNRGRVDADTTKFSSAGMQDALKQIGDRKLRLFFSPAEISQIKSAVNVARYMQSQPIGSAVNNSNSAAMIFGKLSDVLLRGGQRLPIVGPMIADPLRGMSLNFQARQSLKPGNALLTPQEREPLPYNALLLLAGAQGGNN